MQKIVASVLITSLMLAGCARGGEAFLGHWKNVRNARDTLVIERNGAGFILRETQPRFFDGAMTTENIPATLQDGLLQVQTGLGSVALAVDASTGHLSGAGADYVRLP